MVISWDNKTINAIKKMKRIKKTRSAKLQNYKRIEKSDVNENQNDIDH